jgi:hypothetical protein
MDRSIGPEDSLTWGGMAYNTFMVPDSVASVWDKVISQIYDSVAVREPQPTGSHVVRHQATPSFNSFGPPKLLCF